MRFWSYLGSEGDESFNEHSCLCVNVSTSDDPGSSQRLVIFGLVPQGHDSRHFLFGNFNFPPSIGMLYDFSNAKIALSLGVLLNFFTRRNAIFVRTGATVGSRAQTVLAGGRS